MLGKMLFAGCVFGFAGSLLVAETSAGLSAAQIVAKNVAARGGQKAWHAVQTLTESGTMGAGGDQRGPQAVSTPGVKPPGKQVKPMPASSRLAKEAELPFTLELERPRKLRLEVQFRGQTAVQVYDGANGWKVRPYLNRMEVENFTEDELHKAALQSELDGPLVDYAEKGTKVELDGTEKVQDRDTYRLKLTMKDGHSVHVWIDAKTFLETKIEGAPRRLDGLEHPVEIYFSDYRTVEGLQIPFLLETKVLPLAAQVKTGRPAPAAASYPVEKIAIEKVQVNPKLDASLFSKPAIETAGLAKPH
jgi:outer membrane lipoprotein-sorting protein